MTETQAKSGTAGGPTNPVDEETAPSGTSATGRAAVGRAAVPADAPPPKFTRAPGMPPPPDQPPAETEQRPSGDGGRPQTGAAAVTSTMPVVSAPPVTGQPGGAGHLAGGTDTNRASGTARFPVSGVPGHPGGGPGGPGSGFGGPGGAGAPGGPTGAAAVGAARVTEAVRAARSAVSSAASRGPRRARLNVKRIDPWSVMKFSFAVSLVLFVVVIVATAVLYLALDAMGVFESVNSSLTDLISAGGGQGGSGFKITAKGVLLSSALIGLINVVLFTALATLGAFIYNVCADLVGGIEVTLAERD